jgi:Tol biopolymer transport system component
LARRREASKRRAGIALAVAGLLALVVWVSTAWAAPPKTVRVSLKSNGAEVNADNDLPAISGDGRYVAFESVGAFTPGDAGTDGDVFVRDLATGKTVRASVRSNGTEVNTIDGSEDASISADGRFVAFTSDAALTLGDTNGALDVYVHDFKTGTTRRMSLTSGGAQVLMDSENASISADGRYVAFQSDGAFGSGDTNGVSDVYVRDRSTGKTKRASLRAGLAQPTEDSTDPAISGDGRYVAFATSDGQMTADPDYGPDPLLDSDVFVRDMSMNTTERVSLRSNGNEADPNNQVASRDPAISANGGFVTFISPGAFGPADTNGVDDVYMRNLAANKTRLVSLKSNGSVAGNASGVAAPAPLSSSGRYVAFESVAQLVPSDGNFYRDVYMRDIRAGTTRISVKSNGGGVSANHQEPSISADGRFVAFASLGAFTAGDSGNDFDVFLRGPLH